MKVSNMKDLMTVYTEARTIKDSIDEYERYGVMKCPCDIYGRLVTIIERTDRILKSEEIVLE